MGSYNPYPGAEINSEVNEKPMISSLINSVYYFIEYVFIIKAKDKCRLVALQNNRVLCDKYYPTVKGCRIAFGRLFKEKAWEEQIKANWSHFYDPDKKWLEEKTRCLET